VGRGRRNLCVFLSSPKPQPSELWSVIGVCEVMCGAWMVWLFGKELFED
jgi:hypothetical protein